MSQEIFIPQDGEFVAKKIGTYPEKGDKFVHAVSGYIEKDGKILTLRREGGKYFGRIALPHGMVEEGESFEEAVVREVLEETGLHVAVDSLRLEHDATLPPTSERNPGKDVKIHVYNCLLLDDGVVTNLEFMPVWRTKKELLENMDALVPTLKDALEKEE